MKVSKRGSLVVVVFLAALVLVCSNAALAQPQSSLSNDDCAKCHNAPPADIAAAGKKHKDVGCTGCHVGHPPTVKKPIPQCNQCHMGKPHFELKGCLGCHKNPHTPLNITFGNNVTEPCLTCHTPQIEQLRKNKSKHTALDCSRCHDVHGKIPQCTQCHKPHAAEMTAADCKKCHKPHMPTVVTYAANTPSKDCGACHSRVLTMLSASKVKHKDLACAFCHQEKHKMVPKCQDCHGTPHPAGIMAKFPRCGECHNIAHDLNNWTAKATEEAPKQAPKKKRK
ncbi:MAG TPA: cytochrome C [Nitrospirota bacterium]